MSPGPELLTVAGGGTMVRETLNNLAVAAASSSSLKCHMLCCFLVNFFMAVHLHYLVFGKKTFWCLHYGNCGLLLKFPARAGNGSILWVLGSELRSSTSISQLKAHAKSSLVGKKM